MKPKRSSFTLFFASLFILLHLAFVPFPAPVSIPVTDGVITDAGAPLAASASLDLFVEQVSNGSAQQITGLYVESLFSFPVVQQPGSQPGFVSTHDGVVTQFGAASAFGSLGFLAHNNLAGSQFSGVRVDDVISVVHGDGHLDQYLVIQIRTLQALQPQNPYSSFVDLADGRRLTVEDLFYQTYGVKDRLILQTCIASGGQDSWGRLFVIAVPYQLVSMPAFEPEFHWVGEVTR
jgi:hypothetical protein